MTVKSPKWPLRVGILTSHPIQYQAPWFRALAKEVELIVYFAHQPSSQDQGVGFGKAFSWDIDLLSGYDHQFLTNISPSPNVNDYSGCDTPEIGEIIAGAALGRRFDAFIVPGWYLKCYWQAIRACRKAGVPIFVRGDSQLGTPRGWLKKVAKEVYYRWMLRKFDGFLTVGQRHQEYLEHYGVPAKRIFFAPHFVDNAWFSNQADTAATQRQRLRTEWGAEEDTLVCLFVGKFEPKKRPLDLLHATALLGAGYLPVLVGSGELDQTLRAEAATMQIPVRFAGFKNQTELPACYAAADVLVLPSDGGETWGLVVNEAMACGIPAIVSNAAGCTPDLIDAGVTGFTYTMGDVQALAEKISRMESLQRSGHDWIPALAHKLRTYSVKEAVRGTLEAIAATSKRRQSNQH